MREVIAELEAEKENPGGAIDTTQIPIEELSQEQAEEAAEPEVEEPEATDAEPEESPAPDEPPDMDTQFAIQAEAMGIDLSGVHETGEQLSDTEMTHDLDLDALLDDGPGEDTRVQELLQTQSLDEEAPEHEDIDEPEEHEEAPVETDEAEEPVPEADAEADEEESEELVESLELDLAEAEAAIEASTSSEYETLDIDDIDAGDEAHEVGELDDTDGVDDELEAEEEDFEPPPMTEEEQTINMQIDQDLLAIAVEDEDGFASTIVKGSMEDILEEERQADDAERKKKEKKKEKKAGAAESMPGAVETIIMEGETIRNELDRDRLTDEDEDEILAGIRADTREQKKKGIRGGRRRTDPPSWGKIAALVALTIVLVGQVVHQSRETLATNELFASTFGPIYRLIGRPLTPAWDISGWRIEKSKGNFDESGQTLTIETQIRNKSGGNLPYPLIGVALTDRFEETIGHKILEPNEYLGNGLDPRKAVVPENTFIAAMTIDAPSANATGFNLKVCYRLESGQLRCAIGDFK